jgi:hypothetical protein
MPGSAKRGMFVAMRFKLALCLEQTLTVLQRHSGFQGSDLSLCRVHRRPEVADRQTAR